MVSKKIFWDVEGLCRYIRKNDKPFGVIQFILVSDFFQLRPVPNLGYGDSEETSEHQEEDLNIKVLVPHKYVLTEVPEAR